MMKSKSDRLFFIDALRAWAILMMLQGHFIDGLLDPLYANDANTGYALWKYFRGITAPVFFTVSGFIFTYLLLRNPGSAATNPRVKKGIRRGLQLLLIGYLLRLNIFGLFIGILYPGFFLVDVLHCIGLSILVLVGLYWLTSKQSGGYFPLVLGTLSVLIFLLEPIYSSWTFGFMPQFLANYFTSANGSVFTLLPWLGYMLFGALASWFFRKWQNGQDFYPYAILSCLIIGVALNFSSPFFLFLGSSSGLSVFTAIAQNNYLFIRLGDVLVLLSIFMMLRKLFTSGLVVRIGQNTLGIYVMHYIILYGSFTGFGLYKFLHHSLSPGLAIAGALIFVVGTTYLALKYVDNEVAIKKRTEQNLNPLFKKIEESMRFILNRIQLMRLKIRRSLGLHRG